MKYKIGVIAEDNSDVQVVNELIKKISPHKDFEIRKFVGHGCGRLRGKCLQWANQLKNQGCSLLVVLHDLDDRLLIDLRTQLNTLLRACPIERHVVVIPIREIEAWLLSDHVAIQKALRLKRKTPRVPNPEAIINPKKVLGEMIYFRSGKTKRYVVEDNQKIAAHVDITNIRQCSSFIPFEQFIRGYLV